MKYKGLFLVILAIVTSIALVVTSDEYAILGALLFFIVIIGISGYAMLKPKSESNYPLRKWMIILSGSSVIALIMSRVILVNYWIGFWEYTKPLLFLSGLFLIAFIILLIISATAKKENTLYNSSDGVLLLIPVLLFFLLELFHFNNSVSRKSIDQIDGLHWFTELDLTNIITTNRDSLFIESYELIDEINEHLVEVSGGYTADGYAVNGNNKDYPDQYIINSGLLLELQNKSKQVSSSLTDKELSDKLDRITKYLIFEQVNNNTVTEMRYRLLLFKLQLKQIELDKYAAQHGL